MGAWRNKRPVLDRVMDQVSPEPNTGCWLWLGPDDGHGYGVINVNRKAVKAYRVAYELKHGPVPKGLELDHLCRVRCCVNPDHLEPVTHSENCKRSPIMGKWTLRKTHCPYGHLYSQANTYMYRNKRHCRECRKLNAREIRLAANPPCI